MKTDLHVHTRYSQDSKSTLERIIERCQILDIGCIAVTDHDTIEGALRMERLAPFPVIIGEEVMSTGGEIIGYFLREEIPPGLTPLEVINRIRDQGGLVCLPHPFDGLGRKPLDSPDREALISRIDIIEVFNARSLRNNFSNKALAYAVRHNLPQSAGSDAHSPQEVGNAYVDMPPFNGPEEFLQALSHGKIFGERNSFKLRITTALDTMPKRLRGRFRV